MIALDALVLFGVVERTGRRVSASLRVVRDLPGPYVTTEACLAEAMHLAGSRLGWRAQDEIWQIVRSTTTTTTTTVVHGDSAMAECCMRKYRDVPMDFADATLVAFATEERRVRAATFDSDSLALPPRRRHARPARGRSAPRLGVTSSRCATASPGTWKRPA